MSVTLPSVVMTMPTLLCSSITFFVPSSAACAIGICSDAHGVVTSRGVPSSSAPIAPGMR